MQDSQPFVFHWEADGRQRAPSAPLACERSAGGRGPGTNPSSRADDDATASAAARPMASSWSTASDRGLLDEASRLLFAALETVPQVPTEALHDARNGALTDGALVDDVELEQSEAELEWCACRRPCSSTPAHARPGSTASAGRLSSKRLQHAGVRFVTDAGRDRDAVERILNERFGVSTQVPDYRCTDGLDHGRDETRASNHSIPPSCCF